jgi:Raf kinase inhibitor-like YbhB/YbcL family protein
MFRISIALTACWTFLAGAAAAMTLASSDIAPGAQIADAQIYPRCGGQNISPQLSWSGVPNGTKSLVLTMIDTDVKPSQWSHWIVVDLPPEITALPRGASRLAGRAKAIASNFGDAFYDGPCPPNGTGIHHYVITLWAMPSETTSIAANARASDVSAMLARSALDHASLTGWVER